MCLCLQPETISAQCEFNRLNVIDLNFCARLNFPQDILTEFYCSFEHPFEAHHSIELEKVNINIKNDQDVNAYWVACFFGHGKVMKILAEANIDIFCSNIDGVSVLHLAVNRDHLNIVKMLITSGFPLDL